MTTETQLAKKFNPEAFAMNLAKAMESSGQALAAYLKPRENGEVVDKPPNELTEVVKTFTAVAEYWLSDNDRSADLQARLAKAYLDLWGSSVRRLAGEAAPPAARMIFVPKALQTSTSFFSFRTSYSTPIALPSWVSTLNTLARLINVAPFSTASST